MYSEIILLNKDNKCLFSYIYIEREKERENCHHIETTNVIYIAQGKPHPNLNKESS